MRVERAVGVLEHELDPAAQVGRSSLREAASGRPANRISPETGDAGRRGIVRASSCRCRSRRRRRGTSPRVEREGHAPKRDRRLPSPARLRSACPDSRRRASIDLEQIGVDSAEASGLAGDTSRRCRRAHRTARLRASSARGGRSAGQRLEAGSSHRNCVHPVARSAGQTGSPAACPTARPRSPGCREAGRVSCRTRGIASSRRRVYGCGGSREDVVDRAGLDDSAAVHDRDRVDEVAHDAEVVADVDDRDVALLSQARRSRRAGGSCVRTSRPVVGSSITMTLWLADEGHRDRDALLLSTAELVRVAPKHLRGRTGAVRPPRRLAERPRARLRCACASSISSSWRLTGIPGESARDGFWGTYEIDPTPRAAEAGSSSERRSRPSTVTCPPT